MTAIAAASAPVATREIMSRSRLQRRKVDTASHRNAGEDADNAVYAVLLGAGRALRLHVPSLLRRNDAVAVHRQRPSALERRHARLHAGAGGRSPGARAP